jgi:hypothetical protein
MVKPKGSTKRLKPLAPAARPDQETRGRILDAADRVFIRKGTARVIAHSRLRTDLGPPDISYPRVVYHRTTAASSSISVYRIDRKGTRSPRTTRIDSYFNPSIDGTSVIYIRQTLQGMQVEVMNLHTSRSRAIYSVNKGSGRFLWTTAIFGNRRYFTVYNSTTSSIHRG